MTSSEVDASLDGPRPGRPGYFADRAMACHDVSLSSVAEDLALDEALLVEADEGRGPPTVRFWEPREYAVILGASRRIRDDIQVEACRADGVPILRRSSGGGTVVIGPGALNVSVILPATAAPGLSAVDAAQRHVLDRIAASIGRAGRLVTVLGHGDLAIGDRKCGGSAQRRLKRWFMVHCSILYAFPIERIVRYLAIPARQPAYREGRAHRDFVCNLELTRQALVDVLHPDDSPCLGPSPALDGPMGLLPALLAEKYANPSWVERY
jgi:lipoate---protein ligase